MDGAQKNKKYARTTQSQLKWYVEFIQSNRQILSGKNTPNDPQAQNLYSFYGPNKTAAKWKESLSNWKKQLCARARKLKAEHLRTDGGSFSGEELSEFEEQALSAFGMGAVNGLECVTSGLPGTFTIPATPSPLCGEEEYVIVETLIESPTELTVDPNIIYTTLPQHLMHGLRLILPLLGNKK
ncbi:uncharacterized protein LOC105665561 [Ceratitis capitata]|uniref:(Mediterranean fruit fly) hypothetical protein n=1 Tax=Ceratitis capitata TaxID=7213 RepID=A0A811UPM6_CERCA|nr:uncharacterized protein LOC105665561 [Ceratitis capitata]CAD7000840.1 unnamed protein product [Ceratitis capitata]